MTLVTAARKPSVTNALLPDLSERGRNYGGDAAQPPAGHQKHCAIVPPWAKAYTAQMSEEPAAGASQASPADPNADCPRCLKPQALCVCEGIAPIDNKVALLILQHPQEQDRELGTARLAVLHFKDALLKIGLSWPSLTRILGRPADPKRWAVLYLGSVKAAAVLPDRDIVVVNKKGTAVDHQDSALSEIEGVVVLDGTWSQAKALWWRNGWMLKCKRIVLGPKRPSRYGRLRREPRSDGLSTLEAAAMLLARLENKPEIETALHASFERLLARYRELHPHPGGRR
jgi:DTW domain-containing protein